MSGTTSTRTHIIVLSTTIPVLVILLVGLAVWHRAHKRRFNLINRGITPIADEEIESWRTGEMDEKPSMSDTSRSSHHRISPSAGSIQKPASVIVYQNQIYHTSKGSEDLSPLHPLHKHSVEVPQTPILARAPNSRPGLTDETVQGDDAYVSNLRRKPSRLNKSQSGTPRHSQHKSVHSAASLSYGHDHWYGEDWEAMLATRQSFEQSPRTSHHNHSRGYSTHSIPIPPRLSTEEDIPPGGLSPRPKIRKSDIGRAIG